LTKKNRTARTNARGQKKTMIAMMTKTTQKLQNYYRVTMNATQHY